MGDEKTIKLRDWFGQMWEEEEEEEQVVYHAPLWTLSSHQAFSGQAVALSPQRDDDYSSDGKKMSLMVRFHVLSQNHTKKKNNKSQYFISTFRHCNKCRNNETNSTKKKYKYTVAALLILSPSSSLNSAFVPIFIPHILKTVTRSLRKQLFCIHIITMQILESK